MAAPKNRKDILGNSAREAVGILDTLSQSAFFDKNLQNVLSTLPQALQYLCKGCEAQCQKLNSLQKELEKVKLRLNDKLRAIYQQSPAGEETSLAVNTPKRRRVQHGVSSAVEVCAILGDKHIYLRSYIYMVQ